MWRKFKGHAVVGAGGVIGPRGQVISNTQGKKMDPSSGGTGSSLVRAPPLGSFPGRPMPGMNPYMQQPPGMSPYGGMQQPPRYNPYGGPMR